MELCNLGVLWDGSKLEQVPCFYDPIAPFAALCVSRRGSGRTKFDV